MKPRLVLAGVVSLLACSAAFADDGDHRGRATRTPTLPAYQQECASCHIAYPPRFLSAESWRRVMGDLPHHYGTDASLEAGTRQGLTDWLVANAGTGRRVQAPPPDSRITRSSWFVREHDEVSVATWKHPDVKSAANCAACHTRADQGEFRERDIHIPR